ncbi:MAG: peptide-methionine (S)-S-oxide reductase MsrA [Ignavibacteria bacterium]|nr:peptide-methionine (S)-S-oxide reductase MsrA [Ignavibacteria bacterium]
MKKVYLLILVVMLGSCNEVQNQTSFTTVKSEGEKSNIMYDTATFGAGCFWCVEAVFQELNGVHSVVSGYSGGSINNPEYEQVSSGTTGFAEVCQIQYDKSKISFEELLEAFWMSHDPTTLNRQGADVGTQYRSVIFYHDENQEDLAEKYKQKLNNAKVFDKPIVTEISRFEKFFPAEDYHQNYYKENPNKPYCLFIIRPKLEKFRKVFKEKLNK